MEKLSCADQSAPALAAVFDGSTGAAFEENTAFAAPLAFRERTAAPWLEGSRLLTAQRTIAALALTLALVRYYFAATTGLTDDETYYRLWSLAPAISFYDHPPFVSWLVAAGRALAGDNALGVRFFAPLLLLLGSLVQWQAASRIVDASTTFIAGLFFLAMPLLSIGGIVMTPDVPSVLFYGLVLTSLDALHRSQNAAWWYAVGLCAGLGALAKYTNLFAGFTVLIWLLSVPGNIKWLKRKELWLSGALAFLIFSPVLFWNATHGWASFAKQFGRIPTRGHETVNHLADFVASFFGLASPIIAGLAVAGLAHVTSKAVRQRTHSDVLLAASIVPMLAYFLWHATQTRVMPNWPAPLYPSLAICAAIAVTRLGSTPRMRIVTIAATALGIAMTTAIYVQTKWPFATLGRDPTDETRGWNAFARLLANEAKSADAAWIVTSDFRLVGQLNFAFKGSLPVAEIGEDIRYENLPRLPESLLSRDALYIDRMLTRRRPAVLTCFDAAVRLSDLERPSGLASAHRYRLYRVSHLKADCIPAGGLRAAPAAIAARTQPRQAG